MAAARKTGTTAALAAVLALNLLLLHATLTEACSSCSKPPPAPAPCSPSGGGGKCPVNALKLGACASVLGGLVSLKMGHQGSTSSSSSSSEKPCCELLGGLADLDAAVCLCTALRANVLGVVQLSVPVELSVLVNYCGKKVPAGFQCPR
ncbi:putative lipid-binding protein AIR1 [Phragmites australis]|uniref:putative lipid-binding protein AIR1 n=1 Tax=Phragmites australis TaxID=29695 RepID=UPI002D78FFF0|nr:putative lipid-binding protein AIR1 [Phragmites australis]